MAFNHNSPMVIGITIPMLHLRMLKLVVGSSLPKVIVAESEFDRGLV